MGCAARDQHRPQVELSFATGKRDLRCLRFEIRIRRSQIALQPMRLQTSAFPCTGHDRVRHSELTAQPSRRPVRRAIRGPFTRPTQMRASTRTNNEPSRYGRPLAGTPTSLAKSIIQKRTRVDASPAESNPASAAVPVNCRDGYPATDRTPQPRRRDQAAVAKLWQHPIC